MSIEAMCQGDQVVKETFTTTSGSMGGAVDTATAAGAAIDCLIQDMSRSESRAYDARGEKHFYNAFFSSDASLTVNSRAKWTVRDNQALSPAIYLRVLAYYREGRPGEGLLWVADLEQETTRPEL